jgi:hypothetical protein
MTRPLTAAEIDVIEAAIDWALWREGAQYGPAGAHVRTAERALEKAVAELHGEHDGRWRAP